MASARIEIPDLNDDERELLRDAAMKLRNRPARSLVALEAFERVARQLEAAAQR